MMFKYYFFRGLAATLVATLACVIYTKGYYSILVDFSEAVGALQMVGFCAAFCVGASIVIFILHKIIAKKNSADFIFSLLFALVSVILVFVVLGADDPTFQNENASLFIEYYKGFLMPMLFFPYLAWFIVTPIIKIE